MSKIKSLIAFALVLVLAFSMVGCHPKDEIALTIGGVEITSAMYGCALIQADLDARAMIDKQNGAIGMVDYHSQNIDGVKYIEWVENRAMQLCKLYAAYTLKLKELNLTVSEETKNNVYQECYMDWLLGSTIFSSSSYTAYATIMEPNGVSFNTFYELNMSGGYDETIFSYYYGEKGVNKIADEELDKFYTENFGLIYDIQITYGDKATDAEKKEVDDLIKDFKARLEKGEDFKTIKADWDKFEEERKKKNETTSSNVTSSNTSSDATSSGTASNTTSSDATSSGNTSSKEEEKPKAKDENATLVWSSTAGSNSDANFQNIKNMAIGDVKLMEISGGWRLMKKLDLMSDSYYRDINYLAIANNLKGEDFSKDIQAFADTLEIVKNSFAMSQYTVKKLKYNV
ncbi:MAG: hypothetical protein IIW23_03985 [Clostridia bacterium]|nr:hypothetical protein [Clostridia bacterium]